MAVRRPKVSARDLQVAAAVMAQEDLGNARRALTASADAFVIRGDFMSALEAGEKYVALLRGIVGQRER